MARREDNFMFQDKHGHLKLMIFFPREILPAIQFNSLENTLNITLPSCVYGIQVQNCQ